LFGSASCGIGTRKHDLSNRALDLDFKVTPILNAEYAGKGARGRHRFRPTIDNQ